MRTGFQNFSLGETQLIRTQSSTRPLSEQNAVNDLFIAYRGNDNVYEGNHFSATGRVKDNISLFLVLD